MSIARTFDGNAWAYDDPALHAAVLLWLFDYGFNLADFDDWVEAPTAELETPCSSPPDRQARQWPPRRQQLLQWRQRAIDAELRGDADAAEGWVRYLGEMLKRRRDNGVLIPEAVLGNSTRRKQSARRKGKPADDPADTTRNARIKHFHARIAKEGRADATSATASEFGLSTRQVRRVLKP